MREERIANRYGRALFLCVESDDVLLQVEKELSSLAALVVAPSSELRVMLLNPSFSKEERVAVVNEIASSSQMHELTKNLVLLLIEKGRAELLWLVAKAFSSDVDVKLGRVRAKVSSAQKLSEPELAQIMQALQRRVGKNVLADVEIDDKAGLGVRAQIGGLVFDATLSTMLDRFKRKLVEAPL